MIRLNIPRRHFSTSGNRTIKAAVARSPQAPFTVEDVKIRDPRHDEVLIRIVATGLCHTDIAVKERNLVPFPIILGHEGAGVVEEVGTSVKEVSKGDHVIMSYASCGSCKHCAVGKPAYCYDHGSLNFAGSQPDGSLTHSQGADNMYGSFFRQSSFATHSLATENNIVKVPKHLPLHKLAPLGCGIQTGAGAVLNSLKAGLGHNIAVFGCGAVGLSAIMAAKLNRVNHIIALDLNSNRLDMAKELGATHVIQLTGQEAPQDIAKRVNSIVGSNGIEFALDTSGNPRALRSAFDCLKPLGVAGLIGGSAPGTEVGIDMLSLLVGKSVRGIIQGDSVSKAFLPDLIQLYEKGLFPFDKMVTYYEGGLGDINRAIAETKKDCIKPVLIISKP